MVQLSQQFNASNYDPVGDFQPIPEGQYRVMIVSSEIKTTKDGMGSYTEFQMKVQGGDYDGRVLFERLNMWNQNEQAVEIANRTLATICLVTGISTVTDTQQLHGIPFMVYVRVRPGNDQYGPSNDIKGYFDVNGIKAADIRKAQVGGQQPAGGPPQQGQPPAPPQGGYQQGSPAQPAPPQAPPRQVVQHQPQPPQPTQPPQAGYQGPGGQQYQDPTGANGPGQQPGNNAQGVPPAATTSGQGVPAAPTSGPAPAGSQTQTVPPAQPAQPAAQQAPAQAPWGN